MILCALIIFSLSCMGVQSIEEDVPVFIWSTQRVQKLPSVSALPHLNFKQFKDDKLQLFNLKNILLFEQDELNVEDISSHEESFPYIKSMMSSRRSLYLPAVEEASFLREDLRKYGYNVIEIQSDEGIGSVHLKNDQKNLVVVRMPSTRTTSLRNEALLKADQIVKQKVAKFGDLAEFTVIFTAKSQSGAGKSVNHVRVRREPPIITDVDSTIPGFYRTNCIMAYFRGNVTVYDVAHNQMVDVEVGSVRPSDVVSDCQNNTASLKFLYNAELPAPFTGKLHIEYKFQMRSGRRWLLSSADIYTSNEDGAKHQELYPLREMGTVPVGKSYSCGQKQVLKSNKNATTYNETQFALTINGLQIQAFTKNAQAFGDSWDCVGFFTIPIWMSLLSSLLGLLILLLGLYMLSEVKTMDRFDDPKAKNLMIHAVSEN